MSRQLNFVCFLVTPAGSGEKVSLPLVDVIYPLVVVVRV